MTTPPTNDKAKAERKPEHPDIVRARKDLADRAEELARAAEVYRLSQRKVQQAQETLDAELKKTRRE